MNLPATGVLNFFYEASAQTWGFDPADRGSWAVLHSIDGSGTPAPSNAAEFTQLPIAADQIVSFPHWHEDVLSPLASSRFDGFFSLVDEIAPDGWPRQANHQIGGWPLLEQASLWLATQLASNGLYVGNSNQQEHPRYPALAKGSADWRLLLQIDSDDRVGWMWGDAGKLYFLIRTEDLAERRFDRVWLQLQCG